MTVYHDFPWTSVFADERTQFKNGLALAKLALTGCPTGKSPALLLTAIADAPEEPIETQDEYVLVVQIRDYLSQPDGDAAASYYAHKLDGSVAIRDLAALNKVEMLPWDEWGRMEASYNGETGPEYDELIDGVAATCASNDPSAIRDRYASEDLFVPPSMIL